MAANPNHAGAVPPSQTNHALESPTNLEIIHQLRKAQARVRFLKNKLRQRRVSKKTSTHQHLFCTSPQPTTTRVPLAVNQRTFLCRNMGDTNSTENIIMTRTHDTLKPEDLQERGNSENEESVQGSMDSKLVTHSQSSKMKDPVETDMERGDADSSDKIFTTKNSETIGDLLDCSTSQYDPSSNLWDCNQCILQEPQGRCSNDSSSMKNLVSENSTHLQDLEGYLFGQKANLFSSKRRALLNASDPIYTQSTATALVKPENELSHFQSGTKYFKCRFEEDLCDCLDVTFAEQGLMDSNLAAESLLHQVDLPLHHNTAHAQQDMVNKPIDAYEYLRCQDFSVQNFGERSAETQLCHSSFTQDQYHEADSSYFVSKQVIMQQHSAETSSKHCGSDFLPHHPPSANMMHSRYTAAGFEYECPMDEQKGLHGCGGTSREETPRYSTNLSSIAMLADATTLNHEITIKLLMSKGPCLSFGKLLQELASTTFATSTSADGSVTYIGDGGKENCTFSWRYFLLGNFSAPVLV